MKLSEKQKRFADYYIELGNATEAYIRAGYKEKGARANASRLIANDSISTYIQARMAEKDKERIASQDEILETLTRILRGEEAGTELVGIGKGAQEVEQLPPSIEAKIRAGELLGKRYAMWTDKQQVEGVMPVTIVNDLDD
jgi:phage terminase small subunit